jgi:hypothetical protein
MQFTDLYVGVRMDATIAITMNNTPIPKNGRVSNPRTNNPIDPA